jgi:2-polyprenyl-3-methyl-5-hydroxy-6-metoxy-1,4-benzoquinol methylase
MAILDPEFDWLEACPLCQGRDLRVFEVAPPGYSVQPVRVRCRACGLIFSNPQASARRLNHFYSKVYFRQAGYKAAYFGPQEEALQRAKAGRELAQLEACCPRGSMLDVGCAAGYFLAEAKARGWRAEGIEMSQDAAQAAQGRGFKVHVARLEDLRLKRRFDAVHAAHTLEHVKDPLLFLAQLRALLAPGGRLMIEVPNARHLWALLWRWKARLRLRVPPLTYAREHTFDFTMATLLAFHRQAGLRPLLARAYEYEGGALNLRAKAGDSFPKALARRAFVQAALALRLEKRLGSYLQVISEPRP